VVQGIAERFLATGLPIRRLNFIATTLHPELIGRTYTWTRGAASMDVVDATRADAAGDAFVRSPLVPVFRDRVTIRRRLVGAKARVDFPILERLRDEGGTDYVALPVEFSGNHISAVTVLSDHPDGFGRGDLDRMDRLRPLFGRVVEVFELRTLSRNLLDTYVGRNAGARILNGEILRGSGETLAAAMLSCDLRDFTPLSDTLGRDALIAVLNAFFERVAAAVEAHGGEVLKFMGDALLAIFAVPAGAAPAGACGAALAATREAMAALEALNATRAEAAGGPLRYGFALHVGEVMYGNIGAKGRLDFTVIGPAVNVLSRLEGLAGDLSLPIVLSGAFAREVREPTVSVGRHALRGIKEPQEVFTTPDATMARAMNEIWRDNLLPPAEGSRPAPSQAEV
jgi:adenylate cyclase